MTGPNRPLRVESLCETGRDGVATRLTRLPVEVRELHRDVLRGFLATGQAPHRSDLAAPGGIDRDEALRQLRDMDLVYWGADDQVVVAYPFSGRPTGHMVQLDGGSVLHAMCAIDALGIPLMTGSDAVIVSVDPDDGHPIRVERRGESWRWTPGAVVVLLAQTSVWGPAADCLCPATTFRTSRRRAEAHLRGCPDLTGVVLDQARALEVARSSFGSLLAPGIHGALVQPAPTRQEPPMTVEMLHIDGCPNAADYLPRLRQLVACTGVPEPVQVRVVTGPDEAQRERFLGSPTVRVNGRDIDPTAGGRRDYGLSCRLYTGPDGLSGTPPDDWVLTMLRPDPADDAGR
jgi:hypothetical protein